MNPGFRLLVDLSDLEYMDPLCAEHVGEIMHLCNERGIGSVVRIIPDPAKDIGLFVMSFVYYDANVRVSVCKNLEEALVLLRS
jgi:anti-anti-sigma regulatory factor